MYVDNFNNIHYHCADICQKNKKQVNSYTKRYLLQSGKYDLYRCVSKARYYDDVLINFDYYVSVLKYDYDFDFVVKQHKKYSKYLNYDLDLTDYEQKCCTQLFNNRRKRVQRLKSKLHKIVELYNCLFLTLTFTDGVLNTTSEKTRRVYISRFLKGLCIPFYVANIDYGEENEREHYHAIIQTNFIDCHLYKYGIINVERIKKDSEGFKRLSNYINKLSYHAFKDSTGQCRLIYSKKCNLSIKQLKFC